MLIRHIVTHTFRLLHFSPSPLAEEEIICPVLKAHGGQAYRLGRFPVYSMLRVTSS